EELASLFVSSLSCLQDLFDGPQQTVGIVEHDAVKGAPLGLVHVAALQGLEVETNGRQRCFQFVGDRIDKAVVLFIAANLAHQEAGIQNEAGGDGAEEDHAEENSDSGLPVQNDP